MELFLGTCVIARPAWCVLPAAFSIASYGAAWPLRPTTGCGTVAPCRCSPVARMVTLRTARRAPRRENSAIESPVPDLRLVESAVPACGAFGGGDRTFVSRARMHVVRTPARRAGGVHADRPLLGCRDYRNAGMDRGEDLCVRLGVDAVRQLRQSLVKPAPERETVSHRRRQGDRAEVRDVLVTNPARDAPRCYQSNLQPIVCLTETNQHCRGTRRCIHSNAHSFMTLQSSAAVTVNTYPIAIMKLSRENARDRVGVTTSGRWCLITASSRAIMFGHLRLDPNACETAGRVFARARTRKIFPPPR